MNNTKGLVYVFSGDGKGKTSAALGMVLRALLSGMRVVWLAWYKEANWGVSEYDLAELLKLVDRNQLNKLGTLEMRIGGMGFYIQKNKTEKGKITVRKLKTRGVVVDDNESDDHVRAATNLYEEAMSFLKSQKYDLIVLDEICNTIDDKLLDVNQIKDLVTLRGKTHMVLTGRGMNQEIVDLADTVTEMKKVKHAYDVGIPAIKGLDF